MSDSRWMLYGATGYTGALLAEEAVRRGHRPMLAGRSTAKLAALAERLGLEYTAFDLDSVETITAALEGFALVLHAAGPFVHTGDPMICACLTAGTHYLDITGEYPAFEKAFSYNEAARQRGIALISGAGFDVIPTDCLASYVAAKIPGAVKLDIAIDAVKSPSAGTMISGLEQLHQGGRVRRNGELVYAPLGSGAGRVRFSHRQRLVMPIPWGDLSTAYRTTAIPNITTYMAFPALFITLTYLTAPFVQWVFASPHIRRLSARLVRPLLKGPDAKRRQRERCYVWARASDAQGNKAQSWLETMEAYRFTAVAGIRCVEKLLGEASLSGALTPALAFGADFVLEIPETRRFDSLSMTAAVS